MANKVLKGLTVKIGGDSTGLLKALDDVDKQSKNVAGELKEVNKLLKFDPKNTDLLAQKQKILENAVGDTSKKLKILKEAEKQVQAQFENGKVSEAQVRALKREIIDTEKRLKYYEKAAKETKDSIKALGTESKETAGKVDDLADNTEDAADSTEELDDVAGALATGGLAALAAAATAAVTAIVALAEESREYRTAMSRLDTAFKDAGYSAATAKETYSELQSILGETDQAVEASNLLAKFCDTEEELKEMTHALAGVYATFPDSLPIEALAESANETARVGQISGNLADALNWAAEEGTDFGVVLKKNTDFTEMSKKELDKLTDSQRAEYEARKKQQEEIDAYNKRVQEAVSAEDKFNIALENCADEQERQKLIMSTLTKLYGSAATQYKKTNAEVIRANQATEKWNQTTAKVGKTVEPVVTDLKELGVTLLEDVNEPLEDAADFIRGDVIPAVRSVSTWTKQNLPTIKAGVAGVTAAIVALNVATVAATVSQKGLKGALVATTAAQKALALAQKATPWGLVAAGITAVAVAVIAYEKATKDAIKGADALTKEEKELVKQSEEAAAAFRDQKKASDDARRGIAAQMNYVEDLADELKELADESGRVQEKDQARADFIIGELNKALGTEYERVGDIIQNYKELETSINDVIRAKKANLLLDASSEVYSAALQEKEAAYESMMLNEKDFRAQLALTQEKEAEYQRLEAEYIRKRDEARTHDDYRALASYYARAQRAKTEWEEQQGILADKEQKYNDSSAAYESYIQTIIDYEDAQKATLEGNYETAVDLLSKKGSAHERYADKVDQETAKVLATLEQEAVDAGIKAKKYKENFENGVSGYTEEMVKEAEDGYQEALDKFGKAYDDAFGLGEDFGQGLADGIKLKNGAVGAAAIIAIREAVKAAKKEAEINSPSKKTMEIGEGLGEGEVVGIKKTTKDVKKAATEQQVAVLDAYRGQDVEAQRALRSVAEQQTTRQTAVRMTAATANSKALDNILAAIQAGQVLLLDGDALVGGTAGRMDRKLGQLRVLAARGAK